MHTPHVIANRYRIDCEIGKGGMGTVYRATHLGLDRPVAIKILKPEFAADPEVADRFMREARTMARLRHPRAALIYDAGRLPDGRPFFVMEYVEGDTLAEALARDGRFAPERAVRVACEVCEVLAEAHALGIVHRDLKPSNIMLTSGRGVAVLDFGIAKVLSDSTEITKTHATTETGLIIGTPRYMSPEQCLGQPVGPSSDLYSIGVLLYEMLSGQPPFMDPLQSAVLVRQATAPPPPLMSRRPDVPRALALATHALLAKRPQDRPRSARDVRALLEKSLGARERLEGEAVADRAATPTPAPFASTLESLGGPRRGFALTVSRLASAALTLALCGGLLFVWSHDDNTGGRADAATLSDRGPTAAGTGGAKKSVPTLSPEAARHIAASANVGSAARGGVITDARHVWTPGGSVIVAVESRRREGRTRLVVFEPRGALTGGYRVASYAPLDREDFGGAIWAMETADADRDGHEEIVCVGTDAREDPFSRRLVLYAPAERQAYSVRVGLDGRESRAVRVRWSPNAAADRAKPYRSLLRERALADLPRAKS